MATSSSHPRSPSPAADSDGPGEVGAAVWKRRYLALQETVNTEKSSKRKFQYVNYSNSEIHLLTFVRNTTSISRLGRGIRKLIFICGGIRDLVSESDKHSTYLEDPDDIDLNGEFDGVNEDEVEDLKRKYVLRLFVLLAYDCAKLGTQSHSCPGTLPPHP
jgi:hypothetical protein